MGLERKTLPMDSDEMAEALRQSHCDRKTQGHKCQGVVTISRGKLNLDCQLCGQDCHTLENSTALVQEVRELCTIMGVDYDKLESEKRWELLVAVLDLATNGI